ncbi:MAG: SpoIIE family protein phosphatase [bacterium]|nr:SpoIIE family protein phosphatase [bacterium]
MIQELIQSFNIYLVPPILFLLTGVPLAVFSLLKGKRQYENILFALICFWFSLIMPVFICHHIFKGNVALLLKIERSVHIVYVYGPAIVILFVHSLVDKKNRIVEIGTFIFCFLTSLFVFTDYYFYGLWEYKWGYMARGGIVLQIFGFVAMCAIVYSLVLSVKKLKTNIDSHTRLKIKYIMFAILAIGILTIGNFPALSGIGIYPPGNFAFIPILFMAWGIYRHDVIKIDLYTRRRIMGTITKVFVVTALIGTIPVCWWAIGNYSIDHIISKTIPYGLPPLVSFIVTVFLAFLSLRMGENRNESIIFSILMLVYALLSIDIYLNCIITIPGVGLQISRLSHLFFVFIPPLGMHLIRIVVNRRSERWLLFILYLFSIFLLFFSQSDYYLQGMYVYSWGLFGKKAILIDIMIVITAITTAYNIMILVIAYRKNENNYYRHRFLFLLIGFVSSVILSVGNLPAMTGYDMYPPGNFIFITTTLFAIALFRYNLNELLRLMGSFLYYGVTAAAVLWAVYILNVKKSDSFFPLYSGLSILGILALKFFLRQLRDAITGRHGKKLKIAFENLSDKLSKVRSLNEIAECISHTFFADLYCGHCAILFFEKNQNQYRGDCIHNTGHDYIPERCAARSETTITIDGGHPLLEYIDSKYSVLKPEEIEVLILNNGLPVEIRDPLRNAEIILPVFFEKQLSAIILLGLKVDSSVYSQNENEFLYQLAINLGPHIENTKILQNLEKTLEERTRKLRSSEEKYRDLIENTNEIIYKSDWRGNYIYSNPAFRKKFKYTEDEIKNLNYIDLILPEKRESEFAYFKKYLKEDFDSTQHEFPTITKSGKIVWVVQDVKVIKDESGRIKEFNGIVHDITARKAAEDALRESEKNYQQLMNNVNDCVFICTFDGLFKYVNPAVTRLMGELQDDFIGKHYLSIVHPDYREQQQKFYKNQVKKNIETTYCEFPILIKDGAEKWAGQTVRMLKNNEGEVEFYGITRDISDRKKAEDARRDLEKAKSRFFSNISHEIRTPLTLMLGPIESVLQGNYGKEIDDDFFRNLHRNTLSLLKLVNNLLDFSKIEAGKMILRVQEANIVHFARHHFSKIELAGKSKNINLEFNSSADSINLFFDPEKMDRVFMNLLSNALKFTGDGGTISIDINEHERFCRIIVADTGEGIPEKNIYTIFDRFSQADATSTRKHEGTGIGLALVKELVELHGGIIEAESRYIENHKEDHGSIFTVVIPKGIEHFKDIDNVTFSKNSDLDDYVKDYHMEGVNDIEMSQTEESEDQAESGNKQTILVVDDNEGMRDFLKTLLQKEYRVLFAEDGEKGLAAARNHTPDLIVSDVMMPVMSGFDMTSLIKQDSDLKTTPVILLTADTDIMNKVTGLENGADDYLHKPFNSLELQTRISSLLKNYENQKIISRRNKDIEAELEVARLLQERLLPPSIPEISGYQGFAVYIPMDKVGGDFYDIEDRDGSLNIIIADVSGHGLPGAFLAAVTKIALDNITDRTSTARVLSLLNDVILKYTVQSNFVTAFFASINTAANIMRYSSAGHCPSLVYRKKNNELFELNAKGTLLGWMSDIPIEEKTIQLEPGDRVVFHTDGITESENSSNELYGDERLQKTIREYANLPAEKFTQELMKDLEIFRGSTNFEDDITMLVLDVL